MGAIAALVGLLALAAVLVVRSDWFYDQVRHRLVTTVEKATGGRVEMRAFRFDWTRLRAEVHGFVLHGTEPAGKPPLASAAQAAVGLKIVSLLRRDVDVASLEVVSPRVYLLVGPDGRTNFPEPKVKRAGPGTMETLLKLAVGRFDVRDGLFEVESQGVMPFSVSGRDLRARLAYDGAGPLYRGSVSVHPVELRWPKLQPVPVDVALELEFARDRIAATVGELTTGETRIRFTGALENFAAPRVALDYRAAVSLADVGRTANARELRSGTVEVAGRAQWSSGTEPSLTGKLHAWNVEYRDSVVRLGGFRADGTLRAVPGRAEIEGMRLSGGVGGPGRCAAADRETSRWPCPTPVSGTVARATLRGRELELAGVAAAAMAGSFHGAAQLHEFDRYSVKGELAGFEARRAVATVSAEPLPWDGRISGAVTLAGSLRRKRELRATADLAVSPEAGGVPVYGRITFGYEARGKLLDLGQSTLTLPFSRIDISGALGRDLRLRVETRGLEDLLPAFGRSAASVPVKIESGGAAVFEGGVTGSLDAPRVAGHLAATHFSYDGRAFDSLRADVEATASGINARNAALARGPARAEFDLAVALDNWKAGDASLIFGSARARNVPLDDLARLLAIKTAPMTGTLSATAGVRGTVANPLAEGEFEIAKGTAEGETFDRFTGRLSWKGDAVELAGGQIAAPAGQARLAAAYRHAPGNFGTGRLTFDAATDALALGTIHAIQERRAGVEGTLEGNARGTLELQPGRGGAVEARITELHAGANAHDLRIDAKPLGGARFTAASEGRVLRARLESDVAGAVVRGNGEWRMEGDYPGTATVTFTGLDFARQRDLFSSAGRSAFAGSADGELRVDGPVFKSEDIKAELRVSRFELGPAPAPAAGSAPTTAAAFSVRNTSPIVARLANSVVTLDSTRLRGRAGDLTIGGRVLLHDAPALDLRVNGRIDPAVLQDFDHDITAAGEVTADAAIRGPLDAPQVNGRLALRNVSLNVVDFPNGISNANGSITFSGDRAVIQSLRAESGGGSVALTGNAGYTGGDLVFRLHVRAEDVRVRYPEGVSTVASASLNFTGTAASSMVAGTITVMRTGFNPQSDFSSVLASSAEPVRTPAARTGLLGGMNFDVQVVTAPDIQVQSSLTQDIQVEANLRLRGTVTNPALLGRVNITQGQVLFFGTKYTVNQGSISFYNPVKIDPVFDIDLDTKARGIEITLTVSGHLKDLNLTPRSDPPLQFSEIVAVLATGRTPTSDPTLLSQQATAPQSWQQMGASALLGQAIASPVAGRLQRFFGVSKLRIDPTLPGTEYNPQARITLEQQVTADITFTYITNVTTSNPQVVSIEWDFSKQWSAVALREENGLFGLDFFYKRRFK